MGEWRAAFRARRNNPVPLGLSGWEGDGGGRGGQLAAARGLRPESGAGFRRQLLQLRPQPAPTPAPSSGLGTGPQTENCYSPSIAHLSGTPGPPWFPAAPPQPSAQHLRSGVSDLPPFLHVAAAPSGREPQGDTFGTTDPGSAPSLSGPASRHSPVASPGSGTRCRRPAPADPPPSLCLRRPTARPAPPSPGSPRAAPRGGHSRRWAGRMLPGWSRRTPWLR